MHQYVLNELAVRITARDIDWGQVFASRQSDECLLVTFVNPHSLFIALRDREYMRSISAFDHVFADGMLMARAASAARGESVARLSFDGNSIGYRILSELARRQEPIAIVGGPHGVASEAGEKLAAALGTEVSLAKSGYFHTDDEEQKVCEAIREAGIAYVICGMGAPRQERFLLRLRASGWRGVGWTCGGYLQQIADRDICYYPQWVNRLHLRAAFRVCMEPRRMLHRYMIEYVDFFWAAMPLFVAKRKRNAS